MSRNSLLVETWFKSRTYSLISFESDFFSNFRFKKNVILLIAEIYILSEQNMKFKNIFLYEQFFFFFFYLEIIYVYVISYSLISKFPAMHPDLKIFSIRSDGILKFTCGGMHNINICTAKLFGILLMAFQLHSKADFW